MIGSEIGSQSSGDGGVPSAPGPLPTSNRSLDLRTVGEILLLTGLYVLCGKFGLSLAFVNASASAVWPPTGLALAALLLRGNRLWLGVFAGAFVVNISTQGSVLTSLAIATGNTCEAVFGAWLVRRFAHGLRAFDRVQTISYFVVGAALLSTAVSATVGVSSLSWAGLLPREYFAPVWLTWWLGDCVSDIVIAPLLVVWLAEPIARKPPRDSLQWSALLLTVVAISIALFSGLISWRNRNIPYGYLCLLPLLWAAFRFGPRGATVCSFLISLAAVWGTLHHFGPFVRSDPNESLLLLQAFIGAITLTALVLAAIMEERLETEARKSAVLESALDCIITMDQDGFVTEFNPAAEKTFGWKREQAIGRTVAELVIPPELREAHWRGLARFHQTGQGAVLGKRLELTALRADGSRFPVELAIVVSRLEGHPPFFTAYLRDLSERNEARRALDQAHAELKAHAETLEQTVAARTSELRDIVGELEAFSYSLSHDLRAPLRAIQAFSSIVLEEHKKNLGPSGTDMLQKVVHAAKRMEQLIQGVLGFTRVSRQDMKFQTVDIDKLVHELVEERPEFKSAEITIASPLLPMRGDIASLTQCISNLVSNAVKFVAPGAPARVRISTEAMDDEVRLCVADQGIGIDSEAQRKLFQLFQRQHSSSNYEGSGIGLAIVRKAAERMGGTVGVRSEPGQGSTFWLQLRRG